MPKVMVVEEVEDEALVEALDARASASARSSAVTRSQKLTGAEDDEEAAIHEHLDGIDDDETQQINQLDTRERISDSFVIFPTTQH